MITSSLNLSLLEMQEVLDSLKPFMVGGRFQSIQTINDKTFLFTLGKEGVSKNFLVCVKEGQLRFHLSVRKGIKLSSNHPLLALLDQTIDKIELVHEDRILSLQTKEGLFFYALLIPKKSNLFLLNHKMQTLFALNEAYPLAFPAKKHAKEQLKPRFSLKDIDSYFIEIEKEAAFQNQKKLNLLSFEKKIKIQQELLKQLLKEETLCQKYPALEHEADLLKANLSMVKKGKNSLIVIDWVDGKETTLTLEPLESAKEQLKKRYEKAKRLKRGLLIVQTKIEQSKNKLNYLKHELEKITLAKSLDELKTTVEKNEPKLKAIASKKLPYKRFISSQGFEILVGTSAKNNDKLTFSIARGNDLWFHVAGAEGAHVIVKTMPNKKVDLQTIEEAALLALHFSKAKAYSKMEVFETECKWVKKAKGKVGAVFLQQKKTRWVAYNEERIKQLKKD